MTKATKAGMTRDQYAVLVKVWSAGATGYAPDELAIRVALMKLALLGLVRRDNGRWYAK